MKTYNVKIEAEVTTFIDRNFEVQANDEIEAEAIAVELSKERPPEIPYEFGEWLNCSSCDDLVTRVVYVEEEKEEKTVDITPTWAGVVPLLLESIRNGDFSGQKIAEEELLRMAQLADLWVDHERK